MPDWAEDTNYTNGPSIGTPTKLKPDDADIAEGFLPDDPALAQKMNWVLHQLMHGCHDEEREKFVHLSAGKISGTNYTEDDGGGILVADVGPVYQLALPLSHGDQLQSVGIKVRAATSIGTTDFEAHLGLHRNQLSDGVSTEEYDDDVAFTPLEDGIGNLYTLTITPGSPIDITDEAWMFRFEPTAISGVSPELRLINVTYSITRPWKT